VGNSRGELEEKLTLRSVCKKVLVGAAVPSRAGWRHGLFENDSWYNE